MSGINFMMNEEYFKEIKQNIMEYIIGKCTSSNIVGMGDIPETSDPNEIWRYIENEIPKYLGNQKISYM